MVHETSEIVETLLAGKIFTFRNKFDVPYVTVKYHPQNNCWVSTWRGFITPEDIMISSIQKLKLMEEIKITTIINDNREVEGPWYDANDWIQKVWLPQVLALGLNKIAQILSPDAYAALSATEMLNDFVINSATLQSGSFVSIADALRWAGAEPEVISQYSKL